MAQLARINPAAAIACPSCQARLSGLPLDDLAAGAGYDCPHCGQPLQIPARVLARLIEQRDAAGPDDFSENGERPSGSVLQRTFCSIVSFFRGLL